MKQIPLDKTKQTPLDKTKQTAENCWRHNWKFI